MMEFVHVAVAVFSLLSLGRSAPVTSCENLLQSREIQGNQLLGKWTSIGESTNINGAKMLTKMLLESVSLNITAAEETDTFTNSYNQKMFGMCFTLTTNMTLVNNTLTTAYPYQTSAALVNTGCPDCLVIYSHTTIGSMTFSGLQLWSRRVKVSAAELAEFTKQAECLNLTSPVILDSKKDYCPETKTVDLTSALSSLNSSDFSQIEKFFVDESGIKSIFDTVQSYWDQLKQQVN